MAKKKRSKLKKALALGAALAGGLALAKGRGMKGNVSRTAAMEDANLGKGWYNHRMDNIPFADHSIPRYDDHGSLFKGGGIAKRGKGAAYKSGGRVKSMGIAKRGGGAAKR